ncbi:hypothetical protein LTR17_025013 [Elasticomyces elasticus]|nr:hypothetical protein LTR17_025013 [Elasticomyces elasticus]
MIALFTIAFFAAITSVNSRHKPKDDLHNLMVYCSGGSTGQVTDGKAFILWSPSLFLSINLGFGRFTFAEAKALDFAWDLIVGSGGQVLVIALVYPLFRRVLLAHMESQPTPLSTYSSVAFDGVSGTTVWVLIRDLFPGQRGPLWRRLTENNRHPESITYLQDSSPRPQRANVDRVLWLGFIFAFAYLLAFAKMLSLMTGYQAIANAVITPDGSTDFLDAGLAAVMFVVVHDGERIGLRNGYIGNTSDVNYNTLSGYMSTLAVLPRTNETQEGRPAVVLPIIHSGSPLGYGDIGYTISSTSVVDNVIAYGSNVTLIIPTGHTTTHLHDPPLNISLQESPSSNNVSLVAVGQSVMSYSFLAHNVKCIPSAEYKWGFSFLLLLTFCLTSLLYLAILQAMTWRLYEHSRSDRLEHPVNVYQAAVEIAQELSDHFGQPIAEVDCSNVGSRLRCDGVSMTLDVKGLPDARHDQRDLAMSRNDVMYRRFTFGISTTWYRRFAKFLDSDWADTEVVTYWPAKKASGTSPTQPRDDDRDTLVAHVARAHERAASGAGSMEEGSIALQSMRSRGSFDLY